MHRIAVAVAVAIVTTACSVDGSTTVSTIVAVIEPGEEARTDRWDVRVVGTRADEEGFAVGLYAWVSGSGIDSFSSDFEIAVRAADGTEHKPSAPCAEPLDVNTTKQADEYIEGYLCFATLTDPPAQLLLTRRGSGDAMALVVPPPPEMEDFRIDDLLATLLDAGVDASIRSSPYARTFFPERQSLTRTLCLDGDEAQVYEFATSELAEMDAAMIKPDGNPSRGYIDLLYGRLMWWYRGSVIVNYNFADPGITAALTDALGDPLSPDAPSRPVPDNAAPSQLCA